MAARWEVWGDGQRRWRSGERDRGLDESGAVGAHLDKPQREWRDRISGQPSLSVPVAVLSGQAIRRTTSARTSEPQPKGRDALHAAILILALDVARDTYGVPALAGRASANPHIVGCLTRHRLKAGLHTFQNENCSVPIWRWRTRWNASLPREHVQNSRGSRRFRQVLIDSAVCATRWLPHCARKSSRRARTLTDSSAKNPKTGLPLFALCALQSE